MSVIEILLAIGGGAVAGFINTLAGSGTLITLPILMFLGLPANVANGTNRLGVLFQTVISTGAFLKQKEKIPKGIWWLVIPALFGALLGAQIAVDIQEEILKGTIAVIMTLVLGLMFFNTQKWLKEQDEIDNNYRKPIALIAFFFIGIYGGFIQAGIGIVMLFVMVTIIGYTVNQSNIIKNILVCCYTIPALGIFIFNNQVSWKLGLLMMVGQGIGAWGAAIFATQSKHANLWIRRLIILILVTAIFELTGARPLLYNLF